MMRWYWFTAKKDGRESLENVLTETMEHAVKVLHDLGYTDLRLICDHVVRDYSENSELI